MEEIRLADDNRVATLVRKAALEAARRIPADHRDGAVQTVTFAVLRRVRGGFELRDEQVPGYVYVAIHHERLEIEQKERTRVVHQARLAQTRASESSPWQQAMHRAEPEW